MPAAMIFAVQSVGAMVGAAVGTYFVAMGEARNVFAVSFATRAAVVLVAFLLLVQSGSNSAAAGPRGPSPGLPQYDVSQ